MKNKSAFFLLPFLALACGKADKSSNSASSMNAISGEDIKIKISRKVEINREAGINGPGNNFNQYINNINRRNITATIYNSELTKNPMTLECMVGDLKFSAPFNHLVAEIPDVSLPNKNTSADCLVKEGSEVKLAKSIKLRRDIVVVGEKTVVDFNLEEKNEIGALIFTKDSTLTTNGKNIVLDATEVIAKNGRLQTYQNGDTAKADTIGQDGGVIRINSDFAIGELQVTMRGQKGGPSSVIDKSDYTSPKVIENAFKKYAGEACVTMDKPIQLTVKDTNGVAGGASGIFMLTSKENKLDVKISSFGGMGGDGGLSYLDTKGTQVPARLRISDYTVSVASPMNTRNWELQDDYEIKDVVFCGAPVYKCALTVGMGVSEYEPSANKGKSAERCKPQSLKFNPDALMTNIKVKKIDLEIYSLKSQVLTKGLSGQSGTSCLVKTNYDGVACL